MEREELENKILNILSEELDSTILEMWNDYCDDWGYSEHIYSMLEKDDYFMNWDIEDLINLGYQNQFDTADDYFYCTTNYGERSTSDIYDVVDTSEIANYIIEEQKDYDNWDIEELLDEYYNEDEEEDED